MIAFFVLCVLFTIQPGRQLITMKRLTICTHNLLFFALLLLYLASPAGLLPSFIEDTLIVTTSASNVYKFKRINEFKKNLDYKDLDLSPIKITKNKQQEIKAFISFGIEYPALVVSIDQIFYDATTSSWLPVLYLEEEKSSLWSLDGNFYQIKSITYNDPEYMYSIELNNSHIVFVGELMLMASTKNLAWHNHYKPSIYMLKK